MNIDLEDIKDLLLSVEKPSRYTGGEFGSYEYFDSPFTFCMCFPDLYEVGMSNLGIKIVAESMRERGFCTDFCFAPKTDFGSGLKERGIPLYSLAFKKPLREFNMLGFSLQYELSYTNLLYMLELAGIPLLRKDRAGKNYPLIAVGGPCTVNPEPLADFLDIVFIGDGESVDADVGELFVKHGGATKKFFEEISKLDGVYVPALLEVEYDGKRIKSFKGPRAKRAVYPDLDGAIFPEKIYVPNCETVHDRAVIEVMRGCYRGCRFCQAGFIYRPVRKRSVETLTRQACNLIKNTGYNEVSLNSLSTGDYTELSALLKSLKSNLPDDVTLALPSLRVDSFEGDFAQDSRKVSLTFAPEAGSQRLRDVINKDITEEEILRATDRAFDSGYSAVKLYFMMGLPTETDEDMEGIANLCEKIRKQFTDKKLKRRLRISVSLATFVPKPFTPFQWEAQISAEEGEARRRKLFDALKKKAITLSWSDDFTAMLEAVLARGDRRLSKVILKAYENGCTFDGWDRYANRDLWLKAFEETGVDPKDYIRERGEDELLAWDFIDIGVTKKFLLSERKKAYAGKVTGSCKASCKGCGLQTSCHAAKGEF